MKRIIAIIGLVAAFSFAASRAANSAGSSIKCRCSYVYTPDFASSRASKARNPAGHINPSAVSRSTFAMLTALQLLLGLRGVNRFV